MLRHPTASGPQQITLGGTAYSVELGAAQGGPLSLRLCDSITGAAWAASFPKAALERLTLNAGSFKAFDVFVRMLQAALQGGSEGLTLELLSPAELRQNGSNNNSADGAASDASQRGDAAAADAAGRRFLILNYTTEFDRVRFPLPLDVAHAPQAEELADRLRHMHHAMAEQQRKAEEDARRRAEEAARAEAQGRAAQQAQQQAQQAQASLQPQAMAAFAPPPAWSGELAQQPLPQANASATQVASAAPPAHQQEQDAGWQQAAHKLHARLQSTEAALQEAQAENRRLRREREFAKQADAAEAQRAPDMQVLREIVTALERDILEQKTRYQRALQQRSARIEDLETELAGLRASERSLRLKCRSQLAELNDLKQRRGGSGAGRSQSRGEAAATKPPWRSGSASGRSTERGRNQSRGPARSTSRSAGRVPSTHRGAPSGTAAVARPARSRSTGRAPTAGSGTATVLWQADAVSRLSTSLAPFIIFVSFFSCPIFSFGAAPAAAAPLLLMQRAYAPL